MGSYFCFIQGMKKRKFLNRNSGWAARDSLAIMRFFNNVESKKNNQKNVNLLLNYSLQSILPENLKQHHC